MADLETLLSRWQTAGVLDAEAVARIRAHEANLAADAGARPGTASPSSLRWLVTTGLILGAILLACGVVLFVNAHWDQMGPGQRLALVMAMVAVFHLGGGLARAGFQGLSSALHAVGTIATGAAIALVGQIFNIQEHWPGAVLLWALAALAGWALLRDQAQQTLALLLVPAWIFSELGDRICRHIGSDEYMGRLLFAWAILYLTFFAGSRKKVVAGILFAAGAIAAVVGIVLMQDNWNSWSNLQNFIPFATRVWAWLAIALVPLGVAVIHLRKSFVPVAAAIGFAIALPWCYTSWTEHYNYGYGTQSYVRTEPNFAAYALVAAFAIFLCWWGTRIVSRALVNLGIVGFAATVIWFYFCGLWDKMDRALGLIGLGILFLAGGWALEKTRRRILAQMDTSAKAVAGGAQ
jgi:uncharacterized membrane protein